MQRVSHISELCMPSDQAANGRATAHIAHSTCRHKAALSRPCLHNLCPAALQQRHQHLQVLILRQALVIPLLLRALYSPERQALWPHVLRPSPLSLLVRSEASHQQSTLPAPARIEQGWSWRRMMRSVWSAGLLLLVLFSSHAGTFAFVPAAHSPLLRKEIVLVRCAGNPSQLQFSCEVMP